MGLRFVHRADAGEQFFLRGQTVGLALDAHGDHFFEEFFFIGHELMQRGVDQADDDRVTIHGLKQAVEVGALRGQQFIERGGAVGGGLGQDHALDDRQALGLKEHVLGAAEADALGAIRAGAAGIFGIVGIGPNLQARNLVRPGQEGHQFFLLFNLDGKEVEFTQVNFAGGAIDGNPFAFFDHHIADFHRTVREVDADGGGADDTRHAELAGNNGRVGGGAAFAGEDTLGGEHAVDIIRFGEGADHDHRLAFFFGHFFGQVGIEVDLADGGAGGGIHASGEEAAFFLGGFLVVIIELRVQHRIHLFGGYARDGFFARDQAFVGHIDGDFDRGAGGALAVAGLEHPQAAASRW